MNNLTPQLNEQQLTQNIDALQKNGVSNDRVQAYVNNYSKAADGTYTLKTNQQTQSTTPSSGSLGTKPNDSLFGKITDNTITQDIQKIFPGKEIGQSIGTLLGYGITAAKEKLGMVPKGTTAAYDLSSPTPLQVAGDAGQALLTAAAPGVGSGEGVIGRVAANAALGAGLGATGAVAEGKGGSDIASSAGTGAALGGGVSALGEGVGAILNKLPTWLTQKALPKLNGDNVDYALENTGLGSIKSLLNTSQTAKNSYESQIQAILSHPQFATKEISPAAQAVERHLTSAEQVLGNTSAEDLKTLGGVQGLLKQTKTNIVDGIKAEGFSNESKAIEGIDLGKMKSLNDFSKAVKLRMSPLGEVFNKLPNAQLDDGKVISILKQVAPQNKTIIDRVVSGDASLAEQNTLRKELDVATRKAYTDNPQLTFNKQIGKTAADALRNNVQTSAPETAPIFSNYSKEIDLSKALGAAQKKLNNRSAVGLYDLISGLGGAVGGGIPGAAAGVAVEKALRSPGFDLAGAKAISTIAKTTPAFNAATRALKAPIIRQVSQ